jgi:hypothetical protein
LLAELTAGEPLLHQFEQLGVPGGNNLEISGSKDTDIIFMLIAGCRSGSILATVCYSVYRPRDRCRSFSAMAMRP